MGGQDEWLRMHLQPGHNWKCMSSLHTLQCTLAMWRHDKWLVCCCCRCRLPRWRQVIQGNCLNPVYAFYFILLGRHFPPSFSRCVISVSGVCIFDSIAIHTCIYTTHILWSHSIWCVCIFTPTRFRVALPNRFQYTNTQTNLDLHLPLFERVKQPSVNSMECAEVANTNTHTQIYHHHQLYVCDGMFATPSHLKHLSRSDVRNLSIKPICLFCLYWLSSVSFRFVFFLLFLSYSLHHQHLVSLTSHAVANSINLVA